MKKLFSALVILVLFASLTQAQGYRKGVNNLNVGIGFGLSGIYGDMDFPPISVGFQYGFHEKISIGGIIGYSQSSYSWGYFNQDYKWTYSYIIIGARGEYHFMEPTDPVDLYGGLTLGYSIVSVSEPTGYSGYGYSAGASYALFGFHGGVRYLFSPNIGVFGELGYGIGYITVGLNVRL